jgi:hypothetical protein
MVGRSNEMTPSSRRGDNIRATLKLRTVYYAYKRQAYPITYLDVADPQPHETSILVARRLIRPPNI